MVDETDRVELVVLNNAVISGLKAYREKSTAIRLNDWKKSEKALDEFINRKWSLYFPDQKSLSNLAEVIEYLTSQGWKAGKSTVYKHHKQGMLRSRDDGSFDASVVDKYAAVCLKRRDGIQDDRIDKLQRERLVAETRKSIAQAEHWEKKTQIFTGSFVPKDQFEQELSKRAIIFRNDLENFCRTEAAGLISLCDGNLEKTPDVTEFMLDKINVFLSRYAQEKDYPVPEAIAEQQTILSLLEGEGEEDVDDGY